MTIQNDLNEARMRFRMTYVVLSRLSGVSYPATRTACTEGSNPTLETLNRLARVLHLDVTAIHAIRRIANQRNNGATLPLITVDENGTLVWHRDTDLPGQLDLFEPEPLPPNEE